MSPILRLENFQPFQAINVLSDPGHIGGPVVIPNCVQVILRWTLTDGKTGTNVLYGRVGGVPAPTAAQADAIFAALGTGAQWTALAATLSTTNIFAGVSLRSVHAPFQPFVPSVAAGKAGASASAALPNEVAIAITLRTGLVGPSNRGRMYLPGMTSDHIAAGGVIGAARMSEINNWAGTITAALAAQGYTWVIGQPARAAYTGPTGTFHPARAASSVVVTSATVRDNHFDSQRRRGLK